MIVNKGNLLERIRLGCWDRVIQILFHKEVHLDKEVRLVCSFTSMPFLNDFKILETQIGCSPIVKLSNKVETHANNAVIYFRPEHRKVYFEINFLRAIIYLFLLCTVYMGL